MALRLSNRNFIDECSAFVSIPTAAAALPLSNVQLATRDVYRSTFNETVVILGTWGGAGRRPSCFGMFRHRGHGGSVRLQLFSDSAFTTGIYDSGTVPIFADQPLASAIDWGAPEPFLPATDPLAYLAPYMLWFTPASASVASFAITLTDCPAGYWEIGRMWLGTYLELTYQATVADMLPQTSTQSSRTRGGSNRSSIGAEWRDLSLDIGAIAPAQRPLLLDILRQSGTGRDLVLSLFPGAGGRQERDFTVNGKLPSLDALNWAAMHQRGRIAITEN